MGFCHLDIYDNGTVTPRNFSNQDYGVNQIGMFKVDALKAQMEFQGIPEGVEINYHNELVVDETDLVDITESDQIIIAGVDSMAARRCIYEHVELLSDGLLVDVRLGKGFATGIQIPLGNQLVLASYEKSYLFSDEEAAPISCTEKTYMGTCLWASQFILNSIWSYFVLGGEGYPSVVDMHCDYQMQSIGKLK